MAELDDSRRLAGFKPSLLSLERDSVLQACVEEAARLAGAPIAIVSLVMKRIQLFRAAVGLPPDLELLRATARSHSFCQFVVEGEAPFVVTDANSDARVPRTLFDVYGITAYAGVPLRVDGQLLGSLCVIDQVPRQWTPELVVMLRSIAARVSDRLETLAASAAGDELTVVPPRSLAARASLLAELVHRSLAEVGPMVRLARGPNAGMSQDGFLRAGRVLAEASEFYDEMMNVAAELCAATKRVEQSVAVAPLGP